MTSALVIIDFQNTVLTDPPAYMAEIVLERIRDLIGRARKAGLPIIFVQHEEPESVWQAGSDTWQFPNAIAPAPGDYVSPKKYSSAFQETALHAHLAEHGIRRLFICGYATEFCIDSSTRHAASLKFDTVVISDAHTTRDRPHLDAKKIIEHHNWVWREMGQITLCTSDTVQFNRV